MMSRSKHRRLLHLCLGVLSLSLAIAITPAQATLQPTPAPIVAAQPATLLDQGRTLYQSGRFAEAVSVWQTAAQQSQAKGDRANAALSLSYLSLAQQELGQWAEATQSIEQSLSHLKATKPQADAILWAQVLNTQASLLLHTGKAEAALETWKQAQTYYTQAGDTIGSLGSQINQSQALQSLGYYRRAKQQLNEINQQLAKLPDSQVKVSGLRTLGATLQMIGDSTESRKVLEQSLAIAKAKNLKSEISAILAGLGKAATDLNDPDAALAYLEQSEQAAVSPIEKLQARLDRFKLLIDYGLLDQAAPIAPQLLSQLEQLPPNRTSMYGAINFAASLNQLENSEKLLSLNTLSSLLEKTVQSAKSLQDSQAEAYALNQWGKLYGRTEQWAEAETVTQQSLEIARQLQADEIIAQSAWQMGRLKIEQGKTKQAISPYTEAVKSLRAIRGDLAAINPDVQFSFRESVEPVYREFVALLLEGQPGQAELTQARELIESLQVAELDNFFREACLDKTQQIDQVDTTATVVYPIILPDRLAVISSTAGKPLQYHITPISQAEVEETLDQLLAALNPVSNLQARDRVSQQVYDWLIRPIESELKQTKTLVFVLDGKLRNIPMSALYDGKQYLIEKYAVTLSPGLQLMAARSLQQTNIGAIVAGISESRSGFSALPAVETEVKKIAQTVPSSKLLNAQFTGNALSTQLKDSKANVVHLATHGQFSSRLEDTFLLTWDGVVNIKELSELLQSRDASKAIDLLVLSACDTASGDDRAVLGLAGLAVKSGARSTLATLWPVKDKAAATLMTQFYQELGQSRSTKAEALRQAQLHLIRKTDFKDPFFWSGFVMVGNWQ
ncbi:MULTISPECIES: CHAT domain-containing protein [Leptolyngbya]|uniref:CHAT domain-containing protein n=1 Tax=Leptolyngbya TaxID=47251 RepID=UPI0016878568|nr:CHAT domain-containing protein [Leptolyngbya sp. FACHB-1624]MBD1857095.1 CHAT domain-containing protein [Leptolyngbya sp. FACHB-1624]